jgi:serine/threonine protein phosphatase PrpC
LREPSSAGIEILTLDRGPGMADVARCLQDGYSTGKSPGTGLGAISRLAETFEIYSQPDGGTAMVAQLWADPQHKPAGLLSLGVVCLPVEFETACGDNWTMALTPSHCQLMVADGLGHGPHAAQASETAVQGFQNLTDRSPAEILQGLHGPLRATRGASVAVAELRFTNRTALFAGVGNISAAILDGQRSRNMISHNGTLGHELHRIQTFAYPWPPDSLLVMHSDGLQSRWQLDPYPGLLTRHPALVAGVLYRDHQRGRDDVTVVVARERR